MRAVDGILGLAMAVIGLAALSVIVAPGGTFAQSVAAVGDTFAKIIKAATGK